jgi:hypothetical protein
MLYCGKTLYENDFCLTYYCTMAVCTNWCCKPGGAHNIIPYLMRGKSRIRTHETVTSSGFQDRRHQPLGHLSKILAPSSIHELATVVDNSFVLTVLKRINWEQIVGDSSFISQLLPYLTRRYVLPAQLWLGVAMKKEPLGS